MTGSADLANGNGGTSNLKKKGGLYYFRRRVPADLRESIGKVEIIRSLKTSDLAEARRKAEVLNAEIVLQFEMLRRGAAQDLDDQLERIAARYRFDLLASERARYVDRVRGPLNSGPLSEIFKGQRGATLAGGFMVQKQREARALDSHSFGHLEETAKVLLKDTQVAVEVRDRFLWELSRVRVECFDQLMRESSPDFAGPQAPPQAQAYAPLTAEPVEPEGPPVRLLSELIEAHISDHEPPNGSWTKKTAKDMRSKLEEFRAIVGDADITTIRKDAVREYRKVLEQLPARYSTDRKFQGMTIREILALGLPPGLGATTTGNKISAVNAMFKDAENWEWIASNPAIGARRKASKRESAREKRKALTDEDLAKIFSTQFRAAALDATGNRTGDPARYWLPLVMVFTGARPEEVAQLYVEDVVDVEGIAALNITDANVTDPKRPDKGLKTPASNRTIPLHSSLIELGFLDFVEKVRATGSKQVFPELTEGKEEDYAARASEWFNRVWLRKHCKITDSKKVMYSLRHTFATRLKHARVDLELIKELMGHAAEDVTNRHYAKVFEPSHLQVEIEKLDLREPLRALLKS